MPGRLNLILGPMWSGKTSELLRRYNRYKIANKKCLLIKYSEDNRYDKHKVVTHDKISSDAINCSSLEKLDNIVINYDVICIDEIQFFNDAYIYCDKWANNNLIVEVCGLNGDFNRKPFKQISNLIPLVDNLIHLTAIDKRNGLDAPFTIRLIDSNKQKIIGGNEIYDVSCRENL